MDYLSSLQLRTLLIDSIILLFCVLGIVNVIKKSALPLDVNQDSSTLVIETVYEQGSELKKNDVILKVNGINVSNVEEIEIILDGKEPEDLILIEVLRINENFSVQTILVPFYSLTYIIISSLTGIMFLLVAIFILIKCEDEKIATSAHWAFVFTAVIILMTWGNYSNLKFQLGIITRWGFHLGYIFVPYYFLKFSFVFPSQKKYNHDLIEKILVLIAFILFIMVNAAFTLLVNNLSIETIRLYIVAFNICSLFLVVLIFAAVGNFLLSYVTSNSETERKKLRWIILGFIIGPLGYLILWVIPSRIWNYTLVSEEVVLLLIAVVPITFAIAIVKYRLLDIDLIFRRGIVYFIALSALLILYIAFLSILAIIFNNPSSQFFSILAAVSIALLFQPLKQRVQSFVDKKFFRIKYDYRKAIKHFNNEIEKIYDKSLLLDKVIELIEKLIPVKKIGFYSIINNRLALVKSNNIEHNINDSLTEKNISEILAIRSPLSPTGNIESSIEVNIDRELYKQGLRFDLILNIHSHDGRSFGLLVLGEKRNEARFTAEDIDLLATISSRLSLILERIGLQEEVIREHIEAERLEELNKLKSFFVSSVSHDLKTPLTSIRLFADRLKSKNIEQEKRQKYLEIIEGESIRLSKLIDNVLGFAKIERGTRDYNFANIDLIKVISNVLESIEYQLSIGNFDASINLEDKEVFISADEGAIIQVLENIISNAMKYGGKNKLIKINEFTIKNQVFVEVTDDGAGISEKDVENIFQPFYRSKDRADQKVGGAGLGLAISKHIVSAHNGEIKVESTLGKGSKFSLIFPRVLKV